MVTDAPAQDPAKKLLQPEPPVPEMLDEILLVAQHLNTAAAVGTMLPFTYKPVAFTHNLAQAPAEIITVLHKPAEPTAEPMMVFWQPVVTAQPAKQPRNMLFEAVVLQNPAHWPANKLSEPVVL